MVLRYEDNGDAVNSLVVIKAPTSKTSIEGYGTPEAFLAELQNMGLFGKQAYVGALVGSRLHEGCPARRSSR